MRVLVVEDDPCIAHLLLLVLEDEGHAVAHARTLAEGAQVAGRWDAVVADGLIRSVVEPDSAEDALLRDLGTRARVVLTSGRPWVQGRTAGELGVAALVPKPFDLGALLLALHPTGGRDR